MPILGERGQVVQCYGRKIRDDLREGTPTHLYLPGPHARVWNLEALTSSKEVILCEALFDAMTFWVGGFHHVTTSYGVSGFTEAHRAAFRLHGTERVLVAYDGDEAGERAAERVATELGPWGSPVTACIFRAGSMRTRTRSPIRRRRRVSVRCFAGPRGWNAAGAPPVVPSVPAASLAAARPCRRLLSLRCGLIPDRVASPRSGGETARARAAR